MRVVFDQQVFLLQEYGGISRYFCSLASNMINMPDVDAKIIAPLHFNGHIDQLKTPEIVWGTRAPKIPKTSRLIFFASEYAARIAIEYYKPDIIHETYFSENIIGPNNARRVLTVYDMTHEIFSDSWPGSEITSKAKREAAERVDHIICISHSTRNDLLRLFDLPENKVSVIHLGYDPVFDEGGIKQSLSVPVDRPYLLFVGKRDGYKNFDGMLRAVSHSNSLRSEFSIVCFGGGAFTDKEIQLVRDLNLDLNTIIQIDGGDDTLASLYRDATAFVYPSLYEGFGIPLLEAMSMNCPVICSNTSSIPEVAGEAAQYFEPDNEESISLAIEDVVFSPEKRSELQHKGKSRCLEFSWERCADETVSLYRSLM